MHKLEVLDFLSSMIRKFQNTHGVRKSILYAADDLREQGYIPSGCNELVVEMIFRYARTLVVLWRTPPVWPIGMMYIVGRIGLCRFREVR